MDKLIVERNVAVPMRDGVTLRADVYRPEGPGPFPVLLQRTPYGKEWSSLDFTLAAAYRGYAVVNQDTRGRWASDGVHYPMRDEFNDGYDSVEWAGHQPWSSGKVGMFGGSYVGWTQWSAAVMQPPSLKAIFPQVTFPDMYEELMYPGGMLAAGVGLSWSLGAGAPVALQRLELSAAELQAAMQQLVEALNGLVTGQTCRRLPLEDQPILDLCGYSFYKDVVAHPTRDAYWRQMSVVERYGRVQVPAYHLGGWYDIFTHGTLRNYLGMKSQGGTESARRGQKLIMGPWLHGPMNGNSGEVDFGFQASAVMVNIIGIQLRWFDHWLKGEANGIMDEPPVRIYVMGRNEWRDEPEWPLARAKPTRYYLHSAGGANTLHGNGALNLAAPTVEPVDSFVYDPRNPVPTRGGGLCCSAAALPAGAFDQRAVESRPDVLVYTTEPLERELEVTGPLEVRLWAATSAPDTCFTAKLVDVGPCGYARNVQDGAVRAAYRPKSATLVPVTPHEPREYVTDLAATSNVFLPGHRIRVEISSSNFPKLARHPNMLGGAQSEAELRPALQTILHDGAHPSYIVLPVV
jgi:putative CocE/NonD family hydrolase